MTSSESTAIDIGGLFESIDNLTSLDNVRHGTILRKLIEEPPAGFDAYCRRLYNNRHISETFLDFLAEARAALLFQQRGHQVEMRDSPDLRLVLADSEFYAEVKRFRRKLQDRLDDEAMTLTTDTGLLAKIGDTVPTEGKDAWTQLVSVVKHKCHQLMPTAANIIVVFSDSNNAIDDSILDTAIYEINDRAMQNHDFAKLNGLMLVSKDWYVTQGRQVYFVPTARPLTPLDPAIISSLEGIRLAT